MATYDKGTAVDKLENISTTNSNSDTANDARIDAFTPEQQKKVIWRIDRRLVLTLGFLYCVSLMDRVSISSLPL